MNATRSSEPGFMAEGDALAPLARAKADLPEPAGTPILEPQAWLSVVENVGDAIVVVDHDGTILYSNAAAASLFRRSPEDLVGTPFGVPVAAGQRSELEVPGPDGTVIPCEMLVTTTALAGQRAFVVALRDITQLRRIAREEERARREAEAASRATRALLDMVAHELKAPISVIAGYSELVASGELGELPAACVDPIREVSTKAGELQAMVDRMLTAARLEAGRLQQGRDLVDVRALVSEALSRAGAQAALQAARLRMDLPTEDVIVLVDPTQLAIVLDNLLNNAIKYSDSDPEVAVAVRRTADTCEVRVRDRGIGIATDQRAAIFERFRRLPNAGSGGRSGTGLGLAIARDLVELNGGALVVEESAPGQGTRFLLTLPLAGEGRRS